MDKEKILSQNKKDNLYLDEYEKHIKLKGKSFGLMFVLLVLQILLERYAYSEISGTSILI